MGKISVIVPVYKVEKYLSRCVDSIFAQTYKDFELILVDDGSPDRCGEMCEAYGETDHRIVVLHRDNGGLSAARNTGIQWSMSNSNSQWLTFIDSDDWVHPQYLELLLQAAEKNAVPVSACGFERPQTLSEAVMDPITDGFAEKMDAETLLTDHVWNFNYAWGKLYRKELFRELRYPEGKNFEDVFTTYHALFSENKVALIDKALYFYFKNEAGITRSPWTPKELVIFEGMRQQLEFYRKKGYTRALEKEEYLYVNHFAYQICRIRENKPDLVKNRPYIHKLKKEMMKLVRRNPKRFGYRHMPQCYEAAYPHITSVYRSMGAVLRKLKLHK